MMNRRNVGLIYAGVTATLVAAVWLSGRCFQTENATGLTNMPLRDTCIKIWAWSGGLLALSQIAALVIAARMKFRVVVVLAGGALLVIAGFIFLLANMPS